MNILLVEPYYTGSHKQWADGYKKNSSHNVKILSLKGQFWKWRMHGGAITLARMFNDLEWDPDLIFVTDMLDLSTFLSLTRNKSNGIPTAIYFHENQLSYPWSPSDRDKLKNRDMHYGFINYSSALLADRVFFNSKFHMKSFLDALKSFLKQFPDYQEFDTIDIIKEKSEVLFLGMDLTRFRKHILTKDSKPNILWNHRWEFDKKPDEFFSVLYKLKDSGVPFRLRVLGENFQMKPKVFEDARIKLSAFIDQWGYAEDRETYYEHLRDSQIVISTAIQENFGISVVEAMAMGCFPLLPKRLSFLDKPIDS